MFTTLCSRRAIARATTSILQRRNFHITSRILASTLIERVNQVTMASSSGTPKVTSLVDLPSSDAKWVKLQKATYIDAKGKERVWEIASRKTTGSAGVDAVAMGNIIYHPTKAPSTIVVIQFRPLLWPHVSENKTMSARQRNALRPL